MRKALAEAQAAFDEGEIPIGAIVVCQDRIIARAHNLTETLHDVTAHAEMQADYAPHALHPKCQVTGGVLEDECRQLMQDFFKTRR